MFASRRVNQSLMKAVTSSSRSYSKIVKSVIAQQFNNNAKYQRNAMVFKAHYTNPPLDYNHFEFQTCVELQEKACALFGDKPVLGTRNGDKYDWMSYKQLGTDVQKFRNILASKNFKFGDKLALISNNRAEWAVTMYATMSLGGQLVPMYEAQLEKDWKYVIEDSDSKVLVVATDAIYQKVKDYPGRVGKIEHVILYEGADDLPYTYSHLMKKAESMPNVPASDKVTKEDLCTIIYTSGTTGLPKGVELSHINITSDVYGAKALSKESLSDNVSLAFLPWAHIYGMTTELHSLVSTGSCLAIVPHRDQILECLQIAKPTVIFSVPVLFNKVYDGVLKNVATQSSLKQSAFKLAIGIARERNHLLEFGKTVSPFLEWKYKMADKVVLSKIRERLGGRLRYMGSGGAATSKVVLEFFEDIGVSVLEGYGLTETSPVITSGALEWENRRLGCVGVPLLGVTVRIINADTLAELPPDTDGEITVSGPNVMVGYRKNPAANAESFYIADSKRFFRTGDMGRMVEGKFLKITGRIKEQFKLENGKYVVPAPMEDVFGRSPFLAQTFLYGDNKKHTIALMVPNMLEVNAWVEANRQTITKDLVALLPTKEQLADTTLTTLPLFKHPVFVAKIDSEIHRVGSHLKNYEKPGAWLAIAQPFSQENQQLTPKMSLRRNNILAVYQPLIDAIYRGEEGHKLTRLAHVVEDEEQVVEALKK